MTYRGAILDVDGTVVRGDDPIPGARAGIDRLEEADVDRIFVSNNPTKPPVAYELRLGNAGFEVSASEVVTAGTVTVHYLSAEHPDATHFVVGEEGLVTMLTEAGLDVAGTPDDADVVLVSLDRAFDYETLCSAMWALEDGTRPFLGTDPDMIIPAAERDVPGSGAVINAVAGVAGRDPDRILGKPSPVAREMALDALGVAPEECLVVGDRLDTDIQMGADAGMTTVLVRTGVTDDADLERSDVDPDYVLDSLGDIGTVLDASES